jgi:hypothetical protein
MPRLCAQSVRRKFKYVIKVTNVHCYPTQSQDVKKILELLQWNWIKYDYKSGGR